MTTETPETPDTAEAAEAAEAEELQRVRITDPDAVLFRPIIDKWAPSGVVTPEAFKLSTADRKDDNHLSIAQESKTTAEAAYKARAKVIEDRKRAAGAAFTPPVGVLAVTVGEVEGVEVTDESTSETHRPLTVWDDSMLDDYPDDHGHIDYNAVPPNDKGAHNFVAKALRDKAVRRGWKFGPFLPGKKPGEAAS